MKWFTASFVALGCLLDCALAYPHSSNPPKITKNSRENEANYSAPMFPLLGWTKLPQNPILKPDPAYAFESAFLYNPAALVLDDRVWLLYRAQGPDKISRVGLAWSSDGISFIRYTKPVLEPTQDFEKGGVEDPRVIRHNGVFYMMYSAYDGTTARLALATSTDLIHWDKKGLVIPNATDVVDQHATPRNLPTPREGWSKSGAIIPEQINGTWYAHWGDSFLYTMSSPDLLHWNFTRFSEPFAAKLLPWELALMESASAPVKTRDGRWLKLYNAAGAGEASYKQFQYSTGQMLFDDPYGPPVARLETPILTVTEDYEANGQVNQVVFAEGLVQFKGYWRIYYGAGDQFLASTVTPVQPDYPRHSNGY